MIKNRIATAVAVLAMTFSTGNATSKEVFEVNHSSSVNCMTEALYFEARNQPDNGIRAVAHVIKNRAQTKDNSICRVVHEKRGNTCQFSYYCHRLVIGNIHVYERLKSIASQVILNADYDYTRGAQFFHTIHTRSSWDRTMIKTLVIADHAFYRPKEI